MNEGLKIFEELIKTDTAFALGLLFNIIVKVTPASLFEGCRSFYIEEQ